MIETKCSEQLPPENQIVFTVIDDQYGRRNEQTLKRQGGLWFTPDGGMYVYYTPTHWRPATREELEHDRKAASTKADYDRSVVASIDEQITALSTQQEIQK